MKALCLILGTAIFMALLGLLFGGLQGAALMGIVTVIVGLFQLPAAIKLLKEEAKRAKRPGAKKKYDDAEFHDPDGNLEEEYAAAHIALFLRWCVERDLISGHLKEESGVELEQARAGAITYTEFLLSQCDGKLLAAHLSEEGNRFAAAYYDDYLREYGAICDFYSRTETQHDYAALSALLDRRFAEFQAGTLRPLKKPSRWRRFWKKA